MKTLKKILIVLLVGQANLSMAQQNKTYGSFHDLISANEKVLRSDDFYNKSIVLSISMGINKFGMVDTVIYSGGNTDIDRMFDLKKITTGLKANKTEFKTYKSEFVVLMVVVIRGDEHFIKIENGNENLASWISIANNSDTIRRIGKRQIFLPPVLIYSRGKAIKN